MTLKEVAAHAGVSRSAASLALRGEGRLADETRERVLRSMTELGYVYNRSAALLREHSSRLVGVVFFSFDNPFFTQSLQAIEMELDRLGYLAISASSLRSRPRQAQVLRSMREFGVSGLILTSVDEALAPTVRTLEDEGIACLSYTRYEDESIDYVGPNDRAGGRLAAEHLLWHGSRRFTFVGSAGPSSASDLRLAGVMEVLDAAGAGADVTVVRTEVSTRGGYAAGQKLLASGPLPDAVVCLSDTVAFGLISALRAAGCASLPRIIGFDDVEMASYWHPTLTTVSSHPDEMGRLAATAIAQRLEGKRSWPQVNYTTPELVIRESCGCGVRTVAGPS